MALAVTEVVLTSFWIFQPCWDGDLGLSYCDLVCSGLTKLCPALPGCGPSDILFHAGHLPLCAGQKWESSSEETTGYVTIRGHPLAPPTLEDRLLGLFFSLRGR